MFNNFKEYLKDNNFEYEVEGSREINRLKKIASTKSNSKEMLSIIDKLEKSMESEKDLYLNDFSDNIKRYLKLELAEKFFGRKGRYKYSIENDPQVLSAVKILKNKPKYNEILAVR